MFRDAKHGGALRHLPSGYPQINRAWMWGALLAAASPAGYTNSRPPPDPTVHCSVMASGTGKR
jgi:hypothetical protein